jgi:hypothetical protein
MDLFEQETDIYQVDLEDSEMERLQKQVAALNELVQQLLNRVVLLEQRAAYQLVPPATTTATVATAASVPPSKASSFKPKLSLKLSKPKSLVSKASSDVDDASEYSHASIDSTPNTPSVQTSVCILNHATGTKYSGENDMGSHKVYIPVSKELSYPEELRLTVSTVEGQYKFKLEKPAKASGDDAYTCCDPQWKGTLYLPHSYREFGHRLFVTVS